MKTPTSFEEFKDTMKEIHETYMEIHDKDDIEDAEENNREYR